MLRQFSRKNNIGSYRVITYFRLTFRIHTKFPGWKVMVEQGPRQGATVRLAPLRGND
jgi:hypothetical protein